MIFSHFGFTSALVRPEILKSKYTLSVIFGSPSPDDDTSSFSSPTAATATRDQPIAAAVPAAIAARLWMAAHRFRDGPIIATGIHAHRRSTRAYRKQVPALLPDMLRAPHFALRKASKETRVRTDSKPAPGTRNADAVA